MRRVDRRRLSDPAARELADGAPAVHRDLRVGRGNLKQIAEQAGVSYPTVRSRLDKVIDSLRQAIARTQEVRGTILDAVSEGKLDADEAARIIKAV